MVAQIEQLKKENTRLKKMKEKGNGVRTENEMKAL